MTPMKKQSKYLNVLMGLDLFHGAKEGLAERVFANSACGCVQFEAGEEVCSLKTPQEQVGVVLSGGLRAVKVTARGSAVVLNVFTSGRIFGMAGVFSRDGLPLCRVEAVKRSRVFWIPKPVLLSLFREDSRVAENYISCLSERIGFLNSRIENFTAGSSADKLASFLLDLPLRDGNAVMLPCTMLQLSEILGMGRASLYRAMDSLQEAGFISRKGRLITIYGLEAIAGRKERTPEIKPGESKEGYDEID